MSAAALLPSSRAEPGWSWHLALTMLAGIAGGCDGVVWDLGNSSDGAAGLDAPIQNDDNPDGAVTPPPPGTFTVAPGAPWPFCVNGQCSEPWLHCNTSPSTNAGLCVPCIHNNGNANAMQCSMDAPDSRLGVCDLMAGDLFENQCVECLDQHDCGDNEVCSAYQCVPVCLNGIACPRSANRCDNTRSICVACTSAGDCSMNESCNIETGRCVACASDGDCQQVFKPRCDIRDNTCVECLTSADCNGAVCDPQTQTCVASM